jgi:hypothetical protein
MFFEFLLGMVLDILNTIVQYRSMGKIGDKRYNYNDL